MIRILIAPRARWNPPMAPSTEISLTVDGQAVQVPEGTTVAVAVLLTGKKSFHESVSGQPRGPLCGMGICYECRLTVDGISQVRSCMTLCRPGMTVETK